MVFEKMYNCGPTKNNTIQLHIYFSKKTSSITEMKGNFTTLVDFDDTLTVSKCI